MIALTSWVEKTEVITTDEGITYLRTTDRNLEDLMLREYPEALLLHQIYKEHKDGTKLYIFKDLKESVLLDFLAKYSQGNIKADILRKKDVSQPVYQH